MAQIIAVRRDLAGRVVFFRQIGLSVQYSHDSVSWRHAFTLPECTPAPSSEFTVYDTETINQFIIEYTANAPVSVAVGDLTEYSLSVVTPSRLTRNLCAASRSLAATFAAMVNAHLEDAADGQLDLASAVLDAVAGAAEIAALIWGGRAGRDAVKFLGYIVGGATLGSAASSWYATLDNAVDLTECDVREAACAIYRAATATGADKSSLAAALINEFDFTACPSGTMSTALTEWFSVWIEEWPELYTSWLAALTDAELVSCANCGGCYFVDLRAVTHNGIKIWGGGIRSARLRSAYLPSNYKYVSISHDIPDADNTTQVDTVRFTTVGNGFATQSGLTWNDYYLVVTVAGAFNQSSNVTYTAKPTAVTNEYEVDFTGVTLAHGVQVIGITHRVVYASTAAGHAALDPLYDVVITNLEVCIRG